MEMELHSTNPESMKQCKDPESMKVWNRVEMESEYRSIVKDRGSERADVLSHNSTCSTLGESMQPSCMEVDGLQTNFLTP